VAARLTVIVSQASQRDSRSVDLEETLVAELMMTPGLDATLIGPIESIQADSTDFLCLSTFNHNFGFISWLDEPTVAAHWQRLGLAGTVARPGSLSTEQASSLPKPRIYHFQIMASAPHTDILSQLRELQRDRAVKTVGIGLSAPLTRSTSERSLQPAPPLPEKPPAEKGPLVATPLASHAAPTSPLPSAQPEPAARHLQRTPDSEEDEDEQWQELDQLVDDLDAFEF
jgi:hypothetical protein